MAYFKLALIALSALVMTSPAYSQMEPLLMEGKQALYQRVLSKPGARIFDQPQLGNGAPATPFSAYYVYARETKDGSSWVQLGMNRYGEIVGWMPEIDSIPWNQGLTVAFRDPLGADRVLLFRDKTGLKQLVEQGNQEQYRRLYQAAEAGELADDAPVIAIQPRTHVDILKDFYLVPIRDHEDIYLGSEQARMLQVSSVPLLPLIQKKQPPEPEDPQPEKKPVKPFRSAVVFVIDSTLSMDPYIDRTREAVRKIYDTITKEQLTGDVSFGLIAFRDNPDVAPGLEYLTRTYVDLAQGQGAESFFQHVSTLKAATVSSRDFIEDSYAGVNEAIAGINWEGQDARYVVLITDAGPREAGNPLSGTGMSSAALRRLAQDKGIALSVLHLLTPSVMADHVNAEETYRDLSYYPGIGSFYFGVETGNIERFGRVLDALAQQITEQVKLAAVAAAGKTIAEARQTKEAEAMVAEESSDQLAQFQAKVAKLGYALRMRYLQQGDKKQIPNVFNAWLVDRDISDPQRQTLDVRVLLTRDQLSDLHSILRQVLVTAEEGLLSPRTFLNDLKSLAATIARDPDQLGTTTRVTGARAGNLADMGFMREYIEDLPYTGEVMNLSLDNWQDWPARNQVTFINRLEEKINYYEVLHDHTDLWVSLDGGPITGDSVFPIALEMLP
ncbi:MAG: VWA domain-containing protein [Candidatus Thiodiazotropha sp. (ex Monitilora ramsayi)]|nr:VWA domain-containing protein [Candidatus Thiodiazotropha sp. (ex Monitilora ramsayi)]